MEDAEKKETIGLANKLQEELGGICFDFNHVTIPMSRYDELIRAEAELDVALRAYRSLDSYRLSDALLAIFGPAETEKGEVNA